MGIAVCIVDAFTAEPFRGNPAAVCVLEREMHVGDSWMQAISSEMNLSETAFVQPVDDGYALRWFTPTVEAELCGHATLASAHVLWESGALSLDATAHFHTRRRGVLRATKRGDDIELDFPGESCEPTTAPGALTDGIGAVSRAVAASPSFFVVELENEQAVRSLRPDIARLREIGHRAVIVTAPATTLGYDFVSRYFAPNAGIDEDPVTGSAHCALGPYWAPRIGRDELVGHQASTRGGIVRVRVDGDRVHLSGPAVTVLRGELLTSP